MKLVGAPSPSVLEFVPPPWLEPAVAGICQMWPGSTCSPPGRGIPSRRRPPSGTSGRAGFRQISSSQLRCRGTRRRLQGFTTAVVGGLEGVRKKSEQANLTSEEASLSRDEAVRRCFREFPSERARNLTRRSRHTREVGSELHSVSKPEFQGHPNM
jgi:hypothetical protein